MNMVHKIINKHKDLCLHKCIKRHGQENNQLYIYRTPLLYIVHIVLNITLPFFFSSSRFSFFFSLSHAVNTRMSYRLNIGCPGVVTDSHRVSVCNPTDICVLLPPKGVLASQNTAVPPPHLLAFTRTNSVY